MSAFKNKLETAMAKGFERMTEATVLFPLNHETGE